MGIEKKIIEEIEEKFNQFIETGILDNNEFQEYEICINYFDNNLKIGDQHSKTKKR